MTYEVYVYNVKLLNELTLKDLKAAKTEQEKRFIIIAQNMVMKSLVSAYEKGQEDQKSKKEGL